MGFADKLQAIEPDETPERILVRLMESDEHISLKTELPNVMPVVKLEVLADWLEQENMPLSAELVRNFVEDYKNDMVSNKRKGRAEVVRALSELREQEVKKNRWTGKDTDMAEVPK